MSCRWRCTLFVVLGCILLFRPVLRAEGKLDEQQRQKLLEEAGQLSDRAKKMYMAGQYSQAVPLCEKALAIRKEALGPRHPDVAKSLGNLGFFNYLINQHEKAEMLYQAQLSILREVLGPRHPDVAKALNNLGVLYLSMGQYAKVEPVHQEELAILREALGPRHPDVAHSLNSLGSMHLIIGNYAKAESFFRETQSIRREALGPRHYDVAQTLHNLGVLYKNMGQPAKAESPFREALAILKEVMTPRHPDVALALNNLGNLYLRMGLHAKAEPLLQEALAIRKEALGPRHSDVAGSFVSLGNLYSDIGQYAKTEPLYREALAIFMETLGPRHPNVATSLANLGLLYYSMGQYAKAEPLHQEALAIRRAALGPRHPAVAETLNYLGALYVNMGQYAKAEPLLQEALAIRKEALGPQHPDVARSLNNQAELRLARMAHPEAALPLLKQSLDIDERVLGSFITESRLTSLLQKLRDREEVVYSVLAQYPQDPAVQRLAFSLALLRKGRSADEGLQTQRAIQQALTDPQDRSLFERLTSTRSQLASLYLKDPDRVPDYRKTLAALESQSDDLEQQLARRAAAFRSLQPPTLDGVLGRVAQALPKDAALVEWLAFPPRRFSATGAAPKKGPPRYLALVLFPDQHIRVVDLGESRSIDATLADLQDQLSRRRPDFVAAAQKVHRLVMAPLLPALEGRTHLLVSPDGALNLLPLWALHDGQRYLVDTHRITYLTSGRDLLRPAAPAQAELRVTVLAHPDFRPASAPAAAAQPPAVASRAAFLQQLQHVPPLPGTQVEALAIQALFPQARLLLGREASERALRSLAAPAVLHVATHGIFWDDQAVPLYEAAYQPGRTLKLGAAPQVPGPKDRAPVHPLARSALLLAGVEALGQQAQPPPDDNDGVLTALEVSGLNLWGTQLVVLSACDTGRGEVQLGQGVYGLRRAFINAGAETLVTSLWKVSDAETQELMGGYYRSLLQGQGRAEAMRQAALSVRARQPHPYYWAPFIVVGQGDPLVWGRY